VRLNRIHNHLWLAGIPTPARPLYRQRLMRREIIVTENPDQHLVWTDTVIFVKRLPEYLFSFEFWKEELCSKPILYRSACGLLLSYTWLVGFQSDLEIAHEHNLIPKTIDWISWASFIDDFLDHVEKSPSLYISQRYQYGELQLSRLDLLYRFNPTINNFIGGFMPGYMWHKTFFNRKFAQLLAIFVFFSVTLSAMQVGLAVDNSTDFRRISYAFAVFLMFVVVLVALAIALGWITLLSFHLFTARKFRKTLSNDENSFYLCLRIYYSCLSRYEVVSREVYSGHVTLELTLIYFHQIHSSFATHHYLTSYRTFYSVAA
jgi:hypothetical protein